MMKKFVFSIFVALVVLTCPMLAQSASHSANVTWNVPPDATATTTYNVYRSAAACATPLQAMSKVTNVKTASYLDTTITVGAWCYVVTQVQNGAESAYSPAAGGTAQPNAVTVITVVVN